MGKGVKEKITNARLKKSQSENYVYEGGGFKKETYYEMVNGVKVKRIRWKREKRKKKKVN